MWCTLNEIVSGKKCERYAEIEMNGKLYTNSKKVSYVFNSYFIYSMKKLPTRLHKWIVFTINIREMIFESFAI